VNWWVVPGIALFLAGIAVMLLNIVLAFAGRAQPRLMVWAAFLRNIGIGLLALGVGVGQILSAMGHGPDVGGLLFGALAIGFGGLYFIAVTDPVFKGVSPITKQWYPKWGSKTEDQSVEDETPDPPAFL
jgi:hypothetical protein